MSSARIPEVQDSEHFSGMQMATLRSAGTGITVNEACKDYIDKVDPTRERECI